MNKPKVSIFILAYNAEKYIRATINSVLSQNDPSWELIIRDNGSTDHTRQICQRFAQKDPRIQLLHNDKNMYTDDGHPSYDRTFWPNWHGEYIAHLDADDLLHPDFVGRLYQAAKAANADIVFAGSLFFPEGTKPFESKSGRIPPLLGPCGPSDLKESFPALYPCLRTMWGKIFRASFWGQWFHLAIRQQIGFNGGDTYFTLGMLMKAKIIVTVPVPLHYYRLRQGSYFSSLTLENSNRIQEGLILYQRGMQTLDTLNIKSVRNVNFILNVLAGHLHDLMTLIPNSKMEMEDRITFLDRIATNTDYPIPGFFAFFWDNWEKCFCDSLNQYRDSLRDPDTWSHWIPRLYCALTTEQEDLRYLHLLMFLSAVYDDNNPNRFGLAGLQLLAHISPALKILLEQNKDFRSATWERDSCFSYLSGRFCGNFEQQQEQFLTFLDQNELEGAVAVLEGLTKWAPLHPFVIYFRAYLCWHIGEYHLARQIAVCGKALYPTDEDLAALYQDIMEMMPE